MSSILLHSASSISVLIVLMFYIDLFFSRCLLRCLLLSFHNIRSSRLEIFCKNCFYKFCEIHRKTPCQSLFFNKIAGLRLRPAILFKKRFRCRCFLVHFVKLQEHLSYLTPPVAASCIFSQYVVSACLLLCFIDKFTLVNVRIFLFSKKLDKIYISLNFQSLFLGFVLISLINPLSFFLYINFDESSIFKNKPAISSIPKLISTAAGTMFSKHWQNFELYHLINVIFTVSESPANTTIMDVTLVTCWWDK